MTMKKILLVDDEEGIHILYREELEALGYEVHSAMSGDEALIHIPTLKPDLVILDIQMPGMNGIDVLRRIKEQDSKLPVILSSAYQEFKQNLSSWASDDFVVKSADMRELLDSVRRLLGD